MQIIIIRQYSLINLSQAQAWSSTFHKCLRYHILSPVNQELQQTQQHQKQQQQLAFQKHEMFDADEQSALH